LQATGSTLSSTSVGITTTTSSLVPPPVSTTSSSVQTSVTSTSTGSENLTSLFLNLASGQTTKNIIGNYSSLSYTVTLKLLNSSGFVNYTSTYSVGGKTIVNGTSVTEINTSFSVISSGVPSYGISPNGTQPYTLFMAQNGTVIQVYNGTSHTTDTTVSSLVMLPYLLGLNV
jgi:hypothetical protein